MNIVLFTTKKNFVLLDGEVGGVRDIVSSKGMRGRRVDGEDERKSGPLSDFN